MKMFALISAIALVIFIGISVFGFWGMNHGASLTHSDCFASTIGNVLCPDKSDALSFLNFHVDFLKNFSASFSGVNITLFILFIIAAVLILIARAWRGGYFDFQKLVFRFRHLYILKVFVCEPTSALLFWLSLHEQSPSLS